MASRGLRHTIKTLGIILALGTVPGTGVAQSEADRVRADDQERIAEEILAAQSQDGPRSPALIQLLTELGVLYETEGQHVLATVVLEEARQLVRANYGLHTLDQVPLMQQVLANQQAIGNFPMVRALEEELLELAERNPDDLRAAAIHRDAGRRVSDVLRRFLAGEAPAEIYPEGEIYSFWRDDVISSLVSDAQIHYADSAAVLLRNGLHASDELRDLEMQIVRATDMVRQRSRPRIQSRSVAGQAATMQQNQFSIVSNSRRYREDRTLYNPALVQRMNTLADLASKTGLQDAPAALQDALGAPRGGGYTSPYQVARDSFYRLIAYDEAVFGDSADEASLRGRLEAYVQIADWDLLYSQNGAAFDQYVRVHELLKTTGVGEPLIAEIFAPPIPVVLPTFQPNPLETPESTRYIDVSLEITKFGESRRIEIAGATANVSNAAKDDLVNFIKGARFRPRVTDGELGRPSPVAIRYYLD
jgi:hypothetical protein